MMNQGLRRATNSKDSVSFRTLSYYQYFSYYIVNETAVATDEVYFATEHGCILDVDYLNMCLFRKTTLHSLIEQTETTIGGMNRPNNIMDRSRNRRAQGERSYSVFAPTPGALSPRSLREQSSLSKGPNLMRRGTVNLVRNFMLQKI